MVKKEHNHQQVVAETLKTMAKTEHIKGILKSFPEDKRREYVSKMKEQIVVSWYVNNCEDCAGEFSNTLTNWENGKFGDEEGK